VGVIVVAWLFPRFSRRPGVEQPPEKDIPDVALPSSADPSAAGPATPVAKTDPAGEAVQDPTKRIVPVSIHWSYPTISDAPTEIVEKLRESTSVIPRLPSAAFDLLPLLSQPGAGSRQVAAVVERDQSVAAKLLRWVNSSLFGLEGKVNSVHRAVTLLGFDTVRSIVIEDALCRVVAPEALAGLGARTIWRHAAAVSIASKHLAGSVRGLAPDVAATAGLLHDIGLLLLLTIEHEKLESAMKLSRDANQPLIGCEDSVLGYNHQIWGEILVRTWRLPESIAGAIGSHHSPMKEPFDPLAGVLWLADYLASRMGFACPEDRLPWTEEGEIEELMTRVGLKPSLNRYITETMVRELVNSTKYWAAGHEEPEDTTAVCDTVAQ
jgi:HD-like signal output (HDOD) protein